MERGTHLRRVAAGAAVLLFALAALSLAWPRPAGAARLSAEGPVRYDRTYKCDLLERLPAPPELVIFGGSRAQRFEPSFAEKQTGLPTFNFAAQNSRPEDVYAMSRLLFWRAPSVRLHCVWALQATTISDSPLHPGLLAEPRLAQFLPGYLVSAQQKVSVPSRGRQMGDYDEYSARGLLLRNGYDQRLDSGGSFESVLADYLFRMVPKAAARTLYTQTRAKTYFERTLQLFNLHDVEPVLVIMPYHPTALAAFREAGWDAKEKAFKAYLESLRGRYRFHLLDYTDLASFHGDEAAFYDGAHVKASNARRILLQAVKDAPDGFR
jgi:hypothetical protein